MGFVAFIIAVNGLAINIGLFAIVKAIKAGQR
jgi:hypothetical protein